MRGMASRWIPLLILTASALLMPQAPAETTVQVTVKDETLHELDSRVFGQFLERPSWGEHGPENAVDENGQVTVGHVGYYELVTHPDLEKHRLEIEIQGEGAFVHRFNFLPFCGVDE